MPRLADAIFQGDFALGRAPMADPQYGLNNGWSPNQGEYASSTSHARGHLTTLLLEYPLGFNYLPEPFKLIRSLKAMVEVHAESITGLRRGVEWEFSDDKFGRAGEIQQTILNAQRPRSTPTFKWKDRYGRPFQNLLWTWGNELIMNPDTGKAGIVTSAGIRPSDMLADFDSMSFISWDTDPTNRWVDNAWLVVNAKPMRTGDMDGVKDISQGREGLELDIEFTGITDSGYGTRAFAQQLLDRINYVNANPNLRPAAIQNVHADIAAITGGKGYVGNVTDLGNSAIIRR